MNRGDLYLVKNPGTRDPKRRRLFVIASRQALIDSKYSTVICAPVYSNYRGLSTQVAIGIEDGVKHECAVHCDELVSLPKNSLTDYVASLSDRRLVELARSLQIAVGADD